MVAVKAQEITWDQ